MANGRDQLGHINLGETQPTVRTLFKIDYNKLAECGKTETLSDFQKANIRYLTRVLIEGGRFSLSSMDRETRRTASATIKRIADKCKRLLSEISELTTELGGISGPLSRIYRHMHDLEYLAIENLI